MTDIQMGDRVRSKISGQEYTVLGVSSDEAWLERVVTDQDEYPGMRTMALPVRNLTKVEPKWELGASYRYLPAGPESQARYTVVHIFPDGSAATVCDTQMSVSRPGLNSLRFYKKVNE